MEFSMTKNEVDSALQTGMKMLSSDQVNTPNAWNIDLGNLQKILVLIAGGQLQLTSVPVPPQRPDDGGDA